MKSLTLQEHAAPKDALSILDIADRIPTLLKTAQKLKQSLGKNGTLDIAKGYTLGLLFEKPSTRTRISFEVGFQKLGGQVVLLSKNDLQLGRGETPRDTAKVLSRYLDAVMYRAYDSRDVAELARHASIPVINGLDDAEHPCQILADLLTLWEHFGDLQGLEIAYVGDAANNVATSLLYAAPLVGANIRMLAPHAYRPDPGVLAKAKSLAKQHGTRIHVAALSPKTLHGAHVVVTDTWVSMGDETEENDRLETLHGYTITPTLMEWARPDAVFLHCLPAHYGHEVDEEVAHGPQSLVFDEAENRMWAQMALLVDLLGLPTPS